MSKFHFSVLAILLMILAGLVVCEKVYNSSMPHINLPIQSHNTIGEIPLVSQIDSGGVQNVTPRRVWGYIQMQNRGMITSCDSVSIQYVGNMGVSGDYITYGGNQ